MAEPNESPLDVTEKTSNYLNNIVSKTVHFLLLKTENISSVFSPCSSHRFLLHF
jgi:hypothetical protein